MRAEDENGWRWVVAGMWCSGVEAMAAAPTGIGRWRDVVWCGAAAGGNGAHARKVCTRMEQSKEFSWLSSCA
jgi:hypothetical protein